MATRSARWHVRSTYFLNRMVDCELPAMCRQLSNGVWALVQFSAAIYMIVQTVLLS